MSAALAGAVSQIVVASIIAAVGIWKVIQHLTGKSKPAQVCAFTSDVFRAMTDTSKEQLAALREISAGITAVRHDLREQALEQHHLQKTVDAMHGRLDRIRA